MRGRFLKGMMPTPPNRPVFLFTLFSLSLALAAITPSTSPEKTPYNSIFFLKTHKTGSSTFSSILKRLAVNFKSRTPLEINEAAFHTKTLPHRYTTFNATIGPPGPPFGIWSNHIRLPYGLETAKLLVPNTEEIITAVRNPPERFASYVCYFDRECELKLAGAPWAKPKSASRRMGAMDLNHREIINTTHFSFTDFIQGLEMGPVGATPYRMIVMERFDESLALFSLDYNLTAFDMAYHIMKKKTRGPLPPDVRKYLVEHQPRDSVLYQASNRQLDRRIQSYPEGVFQARLEEMKAVRDAVRKFCFRTRPQVTKSELKRVEDGEEIDWNKERARENFAKNSLKKKSAVESLQSRVRGEAEKGQGDEDDRPNVPEELHGLDMGVYGSLKLQCFLLEMDELRWLRWTNKWRVETGGLELTVRNMMEKAFSYDLPHRSSGVKKGGGKNPLNFHNRLSPGPNSGSSQPKAFFSQNKLRQISKNVRKKALEKKAIEKGNSSTSPSPTEAATTTTTTTTTTTATTALL